MVRTWWWMAAGHHGKPISDMKNKIEVLAVIPARGGSKSIPHKNIRLFAGHPLIAFSIAAGLQAESVTRTIVSTDDEKIAEIAQKYGAEVPFIRPDKYSRDGTLDLPVFQHALEWLSKNQDYHPDVVVQLRPTSPVRPRHCVDDAVKILMDYPKADSVRGVVMAGQNPYKMWRIDPDGRMLPLIKVKGVTEAFNVPRQELPDVYWQTGHIDVIRPPVILEKKSMSGTHIRPLIIDPLYTVDIDTLLDWENGERLVKFGNLDMVVPGSVNRKLPKKLEMLVMDFDGVLTDDRVWVDESGHEMIAARRGDALGLRMLREKTSVKVFVLSREANPVVAARCRKMNIPYRQGVMDKKSILLELLRQESVDPACAIYIGNDIVDLPCFPIVACAIAPADAHPDVLQQADIILERKGGEGAVRELCDRLLEYYEKQT
jgi:YrbI family 3-deoxy-D-manno-octulosonate 8-phosphate phosphatase